MLLDKDCFYASRYSINCNLFIVLTGAQACVVAFSTTDRESFEAVEVWKKKVEDEVGEIATVLVQNKIDMMDEALITM